MMKLFDYIYYLSYLYYSKEHFGDPIIKSSIVVSIIFGCLSAPIFDELEVFLFGEIAKNHYLLSIIIIILFRKRHQKKHKSICSKYKNCKYNTYASRTFIILVLLTNYNPLCCFF